MKKAHIAAILSLIIILGAALRIYNLGKDSLSFDEGVDMMIVWDVYKKGLTFPPAYTVPYFHVLLNYYWKYVGSSEFILRFPQAAFSIISILLVYFFSALIFDRKTGLLSAFILAISSFHLHYAQEMRMYSLFCFLALSAAYFFVRCLKTGRDRYLVYFVFCTLIGIYTHYFTLVILSAEHIFLFFYFKRYKRLVLKWFIANSVILLLAFPVLRLFFFIPKPYGTGWVPAVSWYTIPISLNNFSSGYNVSMMPIAILASSLYLSLFIYGAWKSRKNEYSGLLLSYLLFPMLAIFTFSLIKPSCYVDRHFIFSSLSFYILAARGVSLIKKNYMLFFVLVAFFCLSFGAIKDYYSNLLPNSYIHHIGLSKKRDMRGAARHIAANFKAGDTLFCVDKNLIPQLWYYTSAPYLRSSYKENIFLEVDKKIIINYSEAADKINLLTFDIGNHHFPKAANICLDNYRRFWVIVFKEEDAFQPVSKLVGRFSKRSLAEFGGLRLYLFSI